MPIPRFPTRTTPGLSAVRGALVGEKAAGGAWDSRAPYRRSGAPGGVRGRVPVLAYVEIFAREPRPGWDAWGNEVGVLG